MSRPERTPTLIFHPNEFDPHDFRNQEFGTNKKHIFANTSGELILVTTEYRKLDVVNRGDRDLFFQIVQPRNNSARNPYKKIPEVFSRGGEDMMEAAHFFGDVAQLIPRRLPPPIRLPSVHPTVRIAATPTDDDDDEESMVSALARLKRIQLR